VDTQARVTIEELYKVAGKAELVNGEIVEMPPAGDDPGRASLKVVKSYKATDPENPVIYRRGEIADAELAVVVVIWVIVSKVVLNRKISPLPSGLCPVKSALDRNASRVPAALRAGGWLKAADGAVMGVIEQADGAGAWAAAVCAPQPINTTIPITIQR
jgi:hypothetical protein